MSYQPLTNFILSFIHRNSSSYSYPGTVEVLNGTRIWNYLVNLNNNNLTFDENPSYALFNYYVFLCTIWCLSSFTPTTSISSKSIVHFVKVTSEILILNSTFILCLPAILFFNGTVTFLRTCLRIYFRLVHRGKIFLMNSADGFWSIEEYAQSCNFNVFFVIQGDCNLDRIRDKFTKLVENPVYDKMRRLVIQKFGFYCWEKVDRVDITQHVKFLTSTTKKVTETEVFDKIREFNDEIFKMDKPPWEVLVVPKFCYDKDPNNDQLYAIVFRCMHGLMDGISAAQAIRTQILDQDVKLSVDPCAKIHVPLWQRIGGMIFVLTMGVRAVVRNLTYTESNCFHTGKSLSGPKTMGMSRKIDLERLKQLKNKTGTTTTAILLNAFGSALKNLADKKHLTLPAEIRAAPTVAVLPYPDTKPQNRFILAHLAINVKEGQSRVQRLKQIHKAVKNLGQSADVIMNNAMLWLVGRWPVFIQTVVFKLVHATVLLSNVPGFKEQAHVFGGKLIDVVGWTPLKGTTGIGMCLFSYNGQLRAAMIVDKVSLPDKSDVKKLIVEFENELESLSRDADSLSCFTMPQ